RRVLPAAPDVPIRRWRSAAGIGGRRHFVGRGLGAGGRVIICRSDAEIERMRAANQLVADVLSAVEAAVTDGVTTWDLDVLAERLVRDGGAEPAFKGYRGFPATLCTSINEE